MEFSSRFSVEHRPPQGHPNYARRPMNSFILQTSIMEATVFFQTLYEQNKKTIIHMVSSDQRSTRALLYTKADPSNTKGMEISVLLNC